MCQENQPAEEYSDAGRRTTANGIYAKEQDRIVEDEQELFLRENL